MKNTIRVRIIGTLAVVGATLGAVAASSATIAQAAPTYLSGHLIDRATNRCLTSNRAGAVSTQPCNTHNTDPYQFWQQPDFEGLSLSPILINEKTRQCLEGTAKDTGVRTGGCSSYDTAQDWDQGTVGRPPDGDTILPNGWSGALNRLVLDSNRAGQVFLSPPNGGPYQDWHATGSLASAFDANYG